LGVARRAWSAPSEEGIASGFAQRVAALSLRSVCACGVRERSYQFNKEVF